MLLQNPLPESDRGEGKAAKQVDDKTITLVDPERDAAEKAHQLRLEAAIVDLYRIFFCFGIATIWVFLVAFNRLPARKTVFIPILSFGVALAIMVKNGLFNDHLMAILKWLAILAVIGSIGVSFWKKKERN